MKKLTTLLFIIILFSCNNKNQVTAGNNYHGFTDTTIFKLGVDSFIILDTFSFIENSEGSISDNYRLKFNNGKINNYYSFYAYFFDSITNKRHIAYYDKLNERGLFEGDATVVMKLISDLLKDAHDEIIRLTEESESLKKEINRLKGKDLEDYQRRKLITKII